MDYHVHTEASLDAKGTMEEFVKKAKRANIDEIGFSDHIMLSNISGYPCMPVHLMSAYVQKFLRTKESSDLPIKLGVEMDFIPGDVEKIREFVQKYPFDYVIGAVHFIGDWAVDYSPQIYEYLKRDILQVYKEYFTLVKKLCDCGLFDVLAHPDLVKIFGFKPKNDISNILTETAEAMAKSKICVEINTSGLRKTCSEIYPSEQFLKIIHSYDIPIVFGSDAHEPKDVGKNFKEAIKLAKKAGYTHACAFDHREKVLVKI
ncbi:MAG: histidinol-phosphatase HisJ family protein [Candidatus Bathyarchaeia archaeon]